MGITTITTFPKSQVEWGRRTWTRPSFSTISSIVQEQEDKKCDQVVQEQEEEECHESQLSRQRFSMFGKKAIITELNNKCLEQDLKVVRKKSTSNKRVQFNPVFLERVCLFLEAQSPCELKEAHDKQLLCPSLRIICSNWPTPSNRILLNKKSFSISSDNSSIYGKVMIPNLALDKSVLIRYTFDSWDTINDVDASFFGPYLKDTSYDTYEFNMNLQLADRGEIRGKLEFTVRYTIGSIDYYDDKNYQIKIICDPLNNPWNISDDQLFSSEQEDHEHFKTALKDYQHAKPYHKQQPWIKTRYDFTESLQLAKSSSRPLYTTTITPPSSPKLSPSSSIIPPAITLEFNSTLYLSLLSKYCFHTSDHLL